MDLDNTCSDTCYVYCFGFHYGECVPCWQVRWSGWLLHSTGVLPPGYLYLDCPSLTFGQYCNWICAEGYYANATAAIHLTCEESAQFPRGCIPYTCDVLPAVEAPASLEPGCSGRLHGETCSIVCPSESGNRYTNVGQPYFTCSNGSFERPESGFCKGSSCDYAPKSIFGPVHDACEGLGDGASCEMQCYEGYSAPPERPTFQCKAGSWQIAAACIVQGAHASAEVPTALAVEIVISTNLDSAFRFEWALSNQKLIAIAVKHALRSNQSNHLHVEVVPIVTDAANGRKLIAPGSNLNGFGLHIVIEVVLAPTRSQEDILDEMVNQLLGTQGAFYLNRHGHTSIVDGFKEALIFELQEKGESVPQGLLHASVAQGSRSPQLLTNYLFAVADWYSKAWGPCSNSCGHGTRHRDVVCSAGAGLCSQVIPSSIGSCENYEECPFDATCPLGRGMSVGCGPQLGMMLGMLSLPCLCLVYSVLRWVRMKFKPEIDGHRLIQQVAGEKKRVGFRILHPSGKSSVSEVSGDISRASRASTRTAGLSFWKRKVDERIDDEQLTVGSAIDGRVHVVWDIDQSVVETWFEKTCSFALVESLSRSVSHLNIADEEVIKDDDLFEFNIIDPSFFMKDGARAEYFSLTHVCWIPADMKVEVVDAAPPTDDPVVMYHAMISHERCRHDVAWDCLRLPLEDGDKVEVFSLRDGGIWLAGEIFGEQSPLATTVGYRVLLQDAPAIEHMIPASRLRLRYPPGQLVFVYKGWHGGWVNGVVDASAPPDGLGAIGLLAGAGDANRRMNPNTPLAIGPSTPHAIGPSTPRAISPSTPRASSPSTPTSPSSVTPPRNKVQQLRDPLNWTHQPSPLVGRKSITEKEIEPWVEVPVICEGSCVPELVPSYLLRPN